MRKPSYIVTLPPPTPNGGLHIGHMAGPFLASDVFTKSLQLTAHPVFVTSYSDVNQSYVRVTAERQGRKPAELAAAWTADIASTLGTYGCEVGEFLAPDVTSAEFARRLFLQLYDSGVLVRKPFTFLYSTERQAILDEAGVTGFCPVCLDRCKCGICEACAYPNMAQTLLAPRDTLSGSSALELRTVEVLVLEVERFRAQVVHYYAENPRQRTRYRWLVEDALSRPLPDFPVSLPGQWGIPMDHAHFPAQVVNPWAEVMANFVYCYQRAQARLQADTVPRVVNFFGFDNSYFYSIVHVALLGAAELMQWAPHAALINEFYNLDHEKFSTSANHVLWAGDVATRHHPDAVRLFCALNSPGFEKGNFNEQEMVQVVERRFAAPWRRIAQLFNQQLSAGAALRAAEPGILAAGRTALARILRSYSIERFHLRQASEDILHLQAFLLDCLQRDTEPGGARVRGSAFLIKCLAQAMYPIAPQVAGRLFASVATRPIGALDESAVDQLHAVPVELFERVGPT